MNSIQDLVNFPQMDKWNENTIKFVESIPNVTLREILLLNYESYMNCFPPATLQFTIDEDMSNKDVN
jgi:hypothetical protein